MIFYVNWFPASFCYDQVCGLLRHTLQIVADIFSIGRLWYYSPPKLLRTTLTQSRWCYCHSRFPASPQSWRPFMYWPPWCIMLWVGSSMHLLTAAQELLWLSTTWVASQALALP